MSGSQSPSAARTEAPSTERKSVYQRNSIKMATLFTQDELDDTSYASPFLNRLVTMLPIKDEVRNETKHAGQAITLLLEEPGKENRSKYVYQLACTAALIKSKDEKEYLTKVSLLANALRLTKVEAVNHPEFRNEEYKLGIHKAQLKRFLFALDKHPYYRPDAFEKGAQYDDWVRNATTETHSQLLKLTAAIEHLQTKKLESVQGCWASLFGHQTTMSGEEVKSFMANSQAQAAEDLPDVHPIYQSLLLTLSAYDPKTDTVHEINTRVKGLDTKPFRKLPDECQDILKAFGEVYSVGPVFRHIAYLRVLCFNLNNSSAYFTAVWETLRDLHGLKNRQVWTQREKAMYSKFTEQMLRWSGKCVAHYQQVYGLTTIARYQESKEDLWAEKDDGFGAQALRACVRVMRDCWDGLGHLLRQQLLLKGGALDRDRTFSKNQAVPQSTPVVEEKKADGPSAEVEQKFERTVSATQRDRKELADWLNPLMKRNFQMLYKEIAATSMGVDVGTLRESISVFQLPRLSSTQQLAVILEAVAKEVQEDRKTTQLFFDEELRFVAGLSAESYRAAAWTDAKAYITALKDQSIDDKSPAFELYNRMREFWDLVNPTPMPEDLLMELRGWFTPVIDRWLDKVAGDIEREFPKSAPAKDLADVFPRIEKLVDVCKDRPCTVPQLQRFGGMLCQVVVRSSEQLTHAVTELVKSHKSDEKLSDKLIAELNELRSCHERVDQILTKVLGSNKAAKAEGKATAELHFISQTWHNSLNKLADGMSSIFQQQIHGCVRATPVDSGMTIDDVQRKLDAIWKYLYPQLDHLRKKNLHPDSMLRLCLLILENFFTLCEEELTSSGAIKAGKKLDHKAFLRKTQITRVKHSLDNVKDFFSDFGVQLPPAPTLDKVLQALHQNTGHGVPTLQSITASLHKTETVLKLYQEDSMSLIDLFKTYPQQQDEDRHESKSLAAAPRDSATAIVITHRAKQLGVSQEQLLALLELRADKEDDSAAKDFLKSLKPKEGGFFSKLFGGKKDKDKEKDKADQKADKKP